MGPDNRFETVSYGRNQEWFEVEIPQKRQLLGLNRNQGVFTEFCLQLKPFVVDCAGERVDEQDMSGLFVLERVSIEVGLNKELCLASHCISRTAMKCQ